METCGLLNENVLYIGMSQEDTNRTHPYGIVQQFQTVFLVRERGEGYGAESRSPYTWRRI